MSVEIRSLFTGWHTVSREQAARYVRNRMNGMTAIPEGERASYIEEHYLKGVTVKGLQEEK